VAAARAGGHCLRRKKKRCGSVLLRPFVASGGNVHAKRLERASRAGRSAR